MIGRATRLSANLPKGSGRGRYADFERGRQEIEASGKLATVDHIGAVPCKPDIGHLLRKAVHKPEWSQQREGHRPDPQPLAECLGTHLQQLAGAPGRRAWHVPGLPEILVRRVEGVHLYSTSHGGQHDCVTRAFENYFDL